MINMFWTFDYICMSFIDRIMKSKMQMKTKVIFLISLAVILSGCSASTSSAKKEMAAADFEQTLALIEGESYLFTIRSASPAGGRSIQITSNYTLKASDGNFEAYLPYFGRAHSGGYGDGGAIEFNGKPDDLEVGNNPEKKTISVKFTMQAEKDKYTINMNVGSNGYGNLVISSQKRQTITYSGRTSELVD